MNPGPGYLLTVLVFGTLSCQPSESVSADWCTTESPDIESILTTSSDEGVWARDGLSPPRFVELWRAGGLNEGEELAFPLIPSVSANGQLAIADWMLGNLTIVEPDGTWRGNWVRRGQGPGELTLPVASQWVGRSDSLTVFDIDNLKVAFFVGGDLVKSPIGVDPNFLAPTINSGSLRWIGVTPDGSVVLAPTVRASADSGYETADALLLHLQAGAESVDTFAVASLPTMPDQAPISGLVAPGWPMPHAAIGSDGIIFVGGMDARYRIVVFGPTADTTLIVCRDAPALPFGERELRADSDDENAKILERMTGEAPRPDSLAPFGRMFVSHEGHLWVQRERASALRFGELLHGVPGATYDVFDSTGLYLGEIHAPEKARLQAAVGDTVWAYETGELDETWVVAYELKFGG